MLIKVLVELAEKLEAEYLFCNFLLAYTLVLYCNGILSYITNAFKAIDSKIEKLQKWEPDEDCYDQICFQISPDGMAVLFFRLEGGREICDSCRCILLNMMVATYMITINLSMCILFIGFNKLYSYA